MDSIFDKNLSRRDFLKASAAMTALAALPDLTGCASLPDRDLPKLKYGGRLVITGAHILDVRTGKLIKGKNLEIRGDKISLLPGRSEGSLKNAEVIKADGFTIMPGLIDAHCHTTVPASGGFSLMSMSSYMIQLKRNYVQQIENGITTVRDMGALPKYLSKFRRMIKEGDLNGPRVIYCNAITNIKDSHPDIDPSDISIFAKPTQLITGNQSAWFENSKELKTFLNENFENNPHFIKLTMDDVSLMCGKDKIPVYSEEHLKIIFDFAEKKNVPISAHIHHKYGFDRGLATGVSCMEHTIGDARISDKEVKEMARKNISIVPTLTVGQAFSAEEAYETLPSEFSTDFIRNEIDIRRKYFKSDLSRYIEKDIHKENMESLKYFKEYGCQNLYQKKIMNPKPDLYFGILKYAPDNVMRMKEAGVRVGCGTDAGVPFCYHGTLWREIEALTRIGFSNGDALRAATLENAAIVGLGGRAGTIEKGKLADLIILKGNPLKDLKALRNPSIVIKGGKIVFSSNQKLEVKEGTINLS